jgi:carbonic anhydrase
MSEIDHLVENAGDYASQFDHDVLPIPPKLHVAVLACMDSRLRIFGMLGLKEGDAHIIRNAGGIATEDAIRSLTISQRLLGTTEIVVIHHTDCGMERFSDEAMAEAIERETGVRPPFAFGAFDDVERDVRHTIALLRESPFIPHTDNIRGFVFEVESGRMREVR